ncbi:MAG: hypothetical protein JO222_09335 [Frankiales bacterium]|nr:hypothetical protein [Frankiales bacterium]
MTSAQLAVLQHRQQLAVRALLLQRLLPLWQLLDAKRLNETLPTWLRSVTPLVQDSRKASSAVAASYIKAVRTVEGVAGGPLLLAAAAPPEQLLTSLTVTSLVAVRTSLGAGQNIDQAMRTAFVTSSGAASRLALQAGRATVLGTVEADPRAAGWSRLPSPGACDFCLMLSDRGAVYSASTVDFAAHDHCACTATADYGSPQLARVREYAPSSRTITDTERADLRAYLREHYHAA